MQFNNKCRCWFSFFFSISLSLWQNCTLRNLNEKSFKSGFFAKVFLLNNFAPTAFSPKLSLALYCGLLRVLLLSWRLGGRQFFFYNFFFLNWITFLCLLQLLLGLYVRVNFFERIFQDLLRIQVELYNCFEFGYRYLSSVVIVIFFDIFQYAELSFL